MLFISDSSFSCFVLYMLFVSNAMLFAPMARSSPLTERTPLLISSTLTSSSPAPFPLDSTCIAVPLCIAVSPSSSNTNKNTKNTPITNTTTTTLPSDSEWEDSIVLRDGRRYPTAEREKHVGLLSLFAIIYFCVASGPYAAEQSVQCAGPGWTIIMLLIIPMVQHLPMGLLTCELASSMPQNGGYIIWISRAFGNFWAFNEGWWNWITSILDCSLYMHILGAYVGAAVEEITGGGKVTPGTNVAIQIATIAAVITTNVIGVQIVGVMSVLFAGISLAPFFILSGAGMPIVKDVLTHDTKRAQMFEIWNFGEVHWGIALSAILWLGSGWDSPGTVAGDVKNPKRTYPRAVYLAIIAIIVTNLAPVATAIAGGLSTLADRHIWSIETPFWANVALHVAGKKLWWCVEIAAVLTSIGLMNLLVTSVSWSLFALALPGLLNTPWLTVIHPNLRTPLRCIVINGALLMCTIFLSFNSILQTAMTLHMSSLSLEACSLIWLRITEPRMKRPYRIPLSAPWLVVMFIPQFFINATLLLSIDYSVQIFVACIVVCGFTAYFFARLHARLQFHGRAPAHVSLEQIFTELKDDEHAELDAADLPEFGLRVAAKVETFPEALIGPSDDNTDPSRIERELNDGLGTDVRFANDEGSAPPSPLLIRSPRPKLQSSFAQRRSEEEASSDDDLDVKTRAGAVPFDSYQSSCSLRN